MIFYLLLTYGPKPTSQIAEHPAAKAQMRYFQKVISFHPEIRPRYIFDYARRVESLETLPNLKQALVLATDIDWVKVRIDDLSRIFRVTEAGSRQDFLGELQVFGKSLYSVRHGNVLSDFSRDQIEDLLLHAEKSRSPAKQRRNSEMLKARASSIKSRRDRAQRTAEQIFKIKQDLMEHDGKTTLKMIADRANEVGITTTRNGKWTAQNIGRVLKSRPGEPSETY